MKIFVTEFRQETNSFNPVHSSLNFWQQSGIYEGDDVLRVFADKPCAIAGMLAAIQESGYEAQAICGTVMSCGSGGPAEKQVMDFYLERLLPALRENLPLNGLFFSFHGALQTTEYDDAEGEILMQARALVGENCVIAVSVDLHAFISQKMMLNADIISGYNTYPHVDQYQTGFRAAKSGIQAICTAKPVMACAEIPVIIPAQTYSTLEGPFCKLMDNALDLIKCGTLLDISVFMMQPWLDVNGGHSSVLTIADNRQTAERYAQEFAKRLYSLRDQFCQDLYSMEQVIRIAEKNDTGRPVILVDSADSGNAGATGDSMAVAAKILELDSSVKTAIVVNDPAAAAHAHNLGVGKRALFKIGAAYDPASVCIHAEGFVKSLHNGFFILEGPAGRGIENSVGPAAVLRIGNIDIVVCHWMTATGDPGLYRGFGVEPDFYQLVVVKACTSFRVPYAKISDCIYYADTPGTATSDLKKLKFHKLSRDIYPWVDREINNFPIHLARSVL